MEDVGGSSQNTDWWTANDDLTSEVYHHNYGIMRAKIQKFLPYLDQIIITCRHPSEIEPIHAQKLQYLHNIMATKSLSPDQAENCKIVFSELCNNYSHGLNFCLPLDFTTSGLEEKLNYRKNNVFSGGIHTSNKNNQNQNRDSAQPNKIPISGNSFNIINNEMGCLKDLNTINKEGENVQIDKSYCNKNANNDSMLVKNDLPAFSESRLKLNKKFDHATNTYTKKHMESDVSILHTELPTQIFDEMPKNPKNGPVIPKNELKNINMFDTDLNSQKKKLDTVKRTSCVEPLQPPSLPSWDLMNLGVLRINSISTTEQNSSEVTHNNISSSKSSSIICAPLNTQINKLYNTGSEKENKQQFISALKPGTLIDLDNSKVTSDSLHIGSLRPVIKSNGKNADIRPSFADISVPRDPRLRHKSLLSSENNISPFNTLLSLVSSGLNTIKTLAPNTNNSNPKSLKTRAQKISSVFSGQSSSSHKNIQLVNPHEFSEHYRNSIKFKNSQLPRNQNKYNLNCNEKNDNGQYRNSVQMHPCNPYHTQPLTKYCDPLPYKIHSNDTSKRDLRPLKSVETTSYSSYKQYREAKYREQNKDFAINKNQINQVQDKYCSLVNKKMEKNNITDSPFNSSGPVNETATIKFNKIPNFEKFEDNINSTAVLKTDQTNKSHLKANTINEQYLVNDQKNFVSEKRNKLIKDLKITSEMNYSHTDEYLAMKINKNSNTDKDLKIKTIMNENENDKCSEINFEETTNNIPNKVIKDQRASKTEQNSILIDYTDHNKSKKQKECFKKKKFEKIMKDSDCSNNDICGPSKRTRRSAIQNKILENLNVNNCKPKCEIDIITKNDKKLESSESIKNYDNPLKEQSEVVNSSTAESLCIHQHENVDIVSTSGINSTTKYNHKVDNKVLIDLMKNTELMNVISIFQEDDKIDRLNKLLESSDVNTNDDKLKQKSTLNKDKFEIDERKMEKKKIKKKVRAESSKNSNQGSTNIFLNCNSDHNNSNQAENREKIKKKKSHLNELNANTNDDKLKQKNTLNKDKLEIDERKMEKKKTKKKVRAESSKNSNQGSKNIFLNCNSDHNNFNQAENREKIKKKKSHLNELNANTNDDKLKQKNTLNKDKLEMNERKIEKKKTKKKVGAESSKNSNQGSKNTFLNCNLDDNNFNQAENREKIKRKKSHLNELNKGSTSFGKMNGHSSTGQHKLKPNESYGHFEVLKNKSVFEEKQLKIVIAKLNPKIKRSENCYVDTSTNDNIQTNNKPINVKIAQEIKSKKRFVGPLSVKLARKKAEMELSDSQNKRDIKNQHEFEIKKISKRSKSVNRFNKKEKLNSETSSSLMIKKPIFSIRPFQCNKSLDNITDSNKPVEQNPNTSTCIVEKPKLRKTRLTELDKLRGSVGGMFDFEPILNASSKRQCRINKKIDYVNKKVVSSKKKKTSNIEESDSIEDKKFICKVEEPKNIKKKVQKSTFILNKKKKFVKKSMANKTGNVGDKPAVRQPDSHLSIEKPESSFIHVSPSVPVKDEILASITDESTPEPFIHVSPPVPVKDEILASITDESTPEPFIHVSPPVSVKDEILPSITDESTPESFIHVNPPVSVKDEILASITDESTPEPLKESESEANQSPTKETRISTEQPEIECSQYTLKEKSEKCVLAGLSCELINSMLLFKCSVSSCLENFSTAVLIDFSKHIIKNHESVIWDGNCEACHHKLPIISDQYYVKNALEHLVSHHLVLKNTEQNPNAKANLEGVSSFCQDTVKNIPTVKNFLRIRHLPGDRLSVHKPQCDDTSNIFDTSVRKSLSDDTNFINNNVKLNINHGSNDIKLPSSSLQISDVKCLKKRIVSTSKINSNSSDNGNLNMWMKSKMNCEVVVTNSEGFLETGRQIIVVNNGVPIDGAIFLIDTSYTKNYAKKIRQFPMDVMKTQLAYTTQSSLPRLLSLFKCMDKKCAKSFSSKKLFKAHMAIHFSKAEKKKRIPRDKVQQFKMCAYCFKAFDNKESLADHIAEKYTFCEYFCPFCFYCAYTASHVLVHQSVVHTNILKQCIIKRQYTDGTCEYPKEMLSVVDFNKFVLPYKCDVGCCGFSCYLHSEFLEHLNQEHQQCDKFSCYICADKDNGDGFFALRPSLLITHFKLHNLNKYQCIFCLFGSENIDSMIRHLAFEHFEYEPFCLERFTVFGDCESKNIENLKILRLEKAIDDGVVKIINLPAETFTEPEVMSKRSKKRCLEGPDVLSIAMKSARIDEEFKTPDAIVSTVSDSVPMAESSATSESLAHNNELITYGNFVNYNDMPNIKITHVWSEALNQDKKFKVSSNYDSINDKDDVDLSEKIKLNEPEVVSQRSKKRCLEGPDVLSIAMKSARIDEEFKTPDAIVSTVSDSVPMAESSASSESLAHNNELITYGNFVNHNDMPNIKITHVWSEALNQDKKFKVSLNDDIAIDNENDVDLSEKEKHNEGPSKQINLKIEESINESEQIKRFVFPIELDKLFVCEKCEIVFSNGETYYAHLTVCPFWDRIAGQKCVYCTKVYKRPGNMTEHVRLHGPDRFNCSLCGLKVPSRRVITRHMRKHKVENIYFVPDRPNLTNLYKDNFTVFEDETVKLMKEINCNQCPFKGNALNIISHMMDSHTAEQNVDCKDNLYKITQEQPNYSNNSINSLMSQQNEQQNTRLKRELN